MEANNNINVSNEALVAINGLQHKAGTYQYYRAALDRMFRYILHMSDEIGMDYIEALETLRAIDSMRRDLAAIAGPVACQNESPAEPEEIAERVESTFEDINTGETEEDDEAVIGEHEKEDIHALMLLDLDRAVKEAGTAISLLADVHLQLGSQTDESKNRLFTEIHEQLTNALDGLNNLIEELR